MVLNRDVVREYTEILPREIRIPATALKDERHWAVFLYLLEAGERRFGEIGERFEIKSNNDLDPILKNLVQGGLVRRYMKDSSGEGDRRATWYQVTDFGQRYLKMLEELILPNVLPGKVEQNPRPKQKRSTYIAVTLDAPPRIKEGNFEATYSTRP